MTAAGTAVYPGMYKARCTADTGIALSAFVPQVFGTLSITITDLTGGRPNPGDWGYVSFEGGDAAFPVWVSAGGGAGVGGAGQTGATGPMGPPGSGDIDGGEPDSVYGGIDTIVGGSP
jgi:hypothetical protein